MISSTSYAVVADDVLPGQWQCIAFDKQHDSFAGAGKNSTYAMRSAVRACQKKSKYRQTCKSAQSFCEQGPISLIDDRCTVRDRTGKTWNTTGEQACKVAKKQCVQWQFFHGKTSQCNVVHR